MLSNEDAWAKLPEAAEGSGHPLPNWAKALATELPHTAAAVLELDFIYRTTPQFTSRERGLVRRAVAGVNRSAYGLAYADADLRDSGLSDDQLARLDSGDLSDLDDHERRLYRYAEQASRAARDLTDAQVAELREDLGDDRLVGLVLLTAYGNFQDRLIHALAIPLEEQGPLPPLAVKFTSSESTPGGTRVPRADRPEIPSVSRLDVERPVWSDFSFPVLQDRLENQRERAPRVSIPTWEELSDRVPKTLYNRDRPLRIRWSRLVIGRQPEMGTAWIRCLRVFGNEAHQDRAFEESMFWVVTRDLRCFYCMGHCEMLMEVGGLSKDQIADRTRRMADGDWKDFSPAERAAFSLASEMTRTPWTVSNEDMATLETALGKQRALDAIWWIARCQFMTKVSDTFQLQLERDNVFQDFEPPAEQPEEQKAEN
jgi:alkylhydroperoxidase family enzyme